MTFMDPPRALGGPAGTATLRAAPEDFVVREWLGFEADGEGDHLLLRVRKRGANTMWVAKQLARIAAIHPRDVGFAGLKDRDALTEQSYTVPLRSARGADWVGVAGEGFEVVAAERHRRKLKRGALKGNSFALRLRDFSGDADLLETRLRTICVRGVPNYFGPQRFGRGGHNVQVAKAWFSGGAEPERTERGFALSAARSAIFNAVLARRVQEGTWDHMLAGDLANLDGSGSVFQVGEVDETLRDRCLRHDIHPTGPMWGMGGMQPQGAVGQLEAEVAGELDELARGLVALRVEGERRPLRVAVRDLGWSLSGNTVELTFRLPRGSFATALLHELIGGVFGTALPELDE